LPSLAESLSCAELEAAACGIPLVVSDRPFNRAFLSENHAIFIDPLSIDSIADGIKVLLRNQNLRDKMAVECRLLAQRYSLSNRVKRLFNIVSKMG
jgi:glycosyltransferase involved in cell wall biosynthesis